MTYKHDNQDPAVGTHEKAERMKPSGQIGVGAKSPASDILTRSGEDILAKQDLDPALNAKMRLVNNVRSRSHSRMAADLSHSVC
jgi:hypothetical protein